MKLTKAKLKEIIREEVREINENYLRRVIVEPRAIPDILNNIKKTDFDKLAKFVEKLDKGVKAGKIEYSEEDFNEGDFYFPIDDYETLIEYLIHYARSTDFHPLINFLRKIDKTAKIQL